MPTGTLYLLPVPINPDKPFAWTAEEMAALKGSTVFIGENLKTMRRFVRAGGCDMPFEPVTFFEMDKHKNYHVERDWIPLVKGGQNAVLTSEAGCPCIGDPGYTVVLAAHKEGIRVKPLSAKSSITLALMASGLNSQAYTFHGYLPIDTKSFQAKVKDMLVQVQRSAHTHVFIETPFRNNSVMEKFVQLADDRNLLCLAAALDTENESIQTNTVGYWKTHLPNLHKVPVVYVWGAAY
jgi:16S rRNA (cytidine1402-2'-O)-methyltransferase